MIKAKTWNEKDLKGEWVFSYKIDGVRVFLNAGNMTAESRAGKPVYGCRKLLKSLKIQDMRRQLDVEVFVGDFDKTSSMARTIDGPQFEPEDAYMLQPLDSRLYIKTIKDPTAEEIYDEFYHALALGYEGLVLRGKDKNGKEKWLKVKDTLTYDVKVTEIVPGKGQFEGDMGALMTSMGKVGTGFTHAQRKSLNTPDVIGKIIEVECMELTKDGQFRHPRFKRIRWDKNEENYEQDN